ncbi:MAG: hypothetical protein R6X18_05775 [Chloroflexota bacterium]|jgi:hypothetical protein
MKLKIKALMMSAMIIVALIILLQPVEAFAMPFGQDRDAVDPTPVDQRFGVIEAFWEEDDAAELRVGWDRILFYWNEIQPTGPDDWNTLHVLEEWLVEAQEQDRMVMGLLKNTPPWATDGAPFSGVPRGLYLPIDDPENLWAGYVRKVVEYYAPRGVHHWIVWNEPEIAPDVYGHEFAGTTQDYFQLLKVAYLVAKESDPEAMIHLAGWSYWHDPRWLDTFLRVASADSESERYDYYFDAITLHIYFRVETVEELVDETWKIQERYGLRKPIWINETNASPNLDPGWPVERPAFQVDLDQQAWYIVQAHALGLGAEAERVGVYKLIDVHLPPGGESFGILRPNRTRRPAFYAYKTTIDYLQGFLLPVGRQQEQDFYAFSFKRPSGLTRILWSRSAAPLTVQVPALTEEALLVSAVGDTQEIRAIGGFYELDLGGARCDPACDIGGPPVFLVEQVSQEFDVIDLTAIDPTTVIAGTATAVPTVNPEDATATADAMLYPSPTPTQTPTPTSTPTATATPSPTAIPPTATPLPIDTPTPEPTPAPVLANVDSGQPTGLLFIGAGAALAVVLGAVALRKQGQ